MELQATQLYLLTGEQLRALATELARELTDTVKEMVTSAAAEAGQSGVGAREPEEEFTYDKWTTGVKGVQTLLGVSRWTAQDYLHRSWFKPAVRRQGRTVWVNKELAVKLYRDYKNRYQQPVSIYQG
ncbi:MAG: hypothetical protein HDR75_05510 [Bacteroides sp.]|nr:hypothetical protein [Bacteroides sp.]